MWEMFIFSLSCKRANSITLCNLFTLSVIFKFQVMTRVLKQAVLLAVVENVVSIIGQVCKFGLPDIINISVTLTMRSE